MASKNTIQALRKKDAMDLEQELLARERRMPEARHYDYIVAIPSYHRQLTVMEKTLAMLHRHKMDPSRIYIYLANEDGERANYRDALNPEWYRELVVGVKGLAAQRNYVSSQWPVGQRIVWFDDDVEEVYEKRNSKKVEPIENLDEFCATGFLACEDLGLYLWGVHPLDNPFFLRRTVTDDLRFIPGPFYGIVNRHEPDLAVDLPVDDYQRTVQHYIKDGGVVRFNYVAPRTTYWKGAGGQEDRSFLKHEWTVDAMLQRYPGYFRAIRRKDGRADLALKRGGLGDDIP